MLSAHERRVLAALERQTSAEDPRLAHLLSSREPWWRWRMAGRHMITVPALVVVLALGLTGCALQVSSLGLLFIGWAVVGTVVRLVRASGDQGRPTQGAHHPDYRTR